MNGSEARTPWALTCALAVAALAMWAPRVAAYSSYDNGAGQGCVQCHCNDPGTCVTDGFTGGPSTGVLHLQHTTTFGITDCGLCHPTSAGGDLPVRTYVSGAGYGCAGCHGVDYGEVSPNSLQPKSSAYGLRAVHASAGVTVCAGCHFPGSGSTGEPDPAPAILPETVQPPYYGLTFWDNLVDPCSAAQESFEGALGVGLDNDGNGFRDMNDPACQARIGTPTPRSTPGATETPVATATPLTGRKFTKVRPGESIQAAVDGAAPGGKVYVKPGVYQETHGGINAVTINKDGIRLVGLSTRRAKVILQAYPGQKNGIVVEPGPGAPRIQKSVIKGFTVQGFPNNGIVTRSVDNFKILKNESIDNKENGIWPILSAEGLVKKNVSYGSDDSAMWVEDSVNVRVLKNVAYGSVTGIELSNSDDILVQGNEAYDNAVGIGLYMQPGRHRKESNRWTVEKNYIHDNNRPNSAPPGSMAGDLPAGGGILLLGPDSNTIQKNTIENNDFYGLVIIDYCTAVNGSAFNCVDNPPDFDPNPDNNQVLYNTFTHNGTNPPPDDPMKPLASDIVLFGGGSNNCFWGNTYSTKFYLGGPLPSCL